MKVSNMQDILNGKTWKNGIQNRWGGKVADGMRSKTLRKNKKDLLVKVELNVLHIPRIQQWWK
jgi:hypothetical protein